MFWFLIFLLPIVAHGATECPPEKCPPLGLWSDWTTTETCPTTCGGCSQITYTRTCLSEQMNCPCQGDLTKKMVCNTQACNWPRYNASSLNCCDGKTTQMIKNWMHCVPLPDNYTLSCCPDTGYWSNWSAWSKVANQVAWQRTRKCLSGGYGCPCKGDSVFIQSTCPCTTQIKVITSDTNGCTGQTAHDSPYSPRTPVYMPSRCQTQIVLEASMFRQPFYTQNADGDYEGAIGWNNTLNVCTQATFISPDRASAGGSNGQFLKYYLDCNLADLTWGGTVAGVAMKGVTAFAQYY